jgi:NTE family protein
MARPLAACALALALSACRATAPVPAHPGPPAPADDLPPRVALVLGGGGARGFAHVGVIRVLEDAGVPVELIVGTSVGSLVGALYAGNTNAREMERLARGLDRGDFFDFSLAPALFGTGLASGERLERFVRERAGVERIEELRIPYAAVATDLDTGEAVVLRAGDLARAVRASSAIPGVFEPVELDGRLLVDGGVARNLPVLAARELGADVVIAVDVSALSPDRRPGNFVEVFLRAVNIAVHAGLDDARRHADVLVAPAVGTIGFIDFGEKDAAIAAGARAAEEALPAIRAAVARWRPARADARAAGRLASPR